MSDQKNYRFLVEKFGEDVIKQRYTNMEKRANAFIAKSGYQKILKLNHTILDAVMLDYFTDLSRLKDFEGISRANKNKITAFMAYWWVRRKPIQVISDEITNDDLVYINEKFIASVIAKDFMSENTSKLLKLDACQKCLDHIYYHLRYRVYTAQTLEMFLMGIDTGIEIGKVNKD